jgi:hypothetical protein
MKKYLILALLSFTLSVVFTFSSGCTTTDSENIKTSGIYATLEVEQESGLATVRARAILRVGGPLGTVVDLSGGEHMDCNEDTLTEWVEPITNYHWSAKTINESNDGLYDFVFVRVEDELVSSQIEMPEDMVVTDASPAVTILDGELFTLTWTVPVTAGDEVRVSLVGTCIDDINDVVPDTGSHSVLVNHDIEAPATCTLGVRVTRKNSDVVNSAYEGGIISAASYDRFDIDFSATK